MGEENIKLDDYGDFSELIQRLKVVLHFLKRSNTAETFELIVQESKAISFTEIEERISTIENATEFLVIGHSNSGKSTFVNFLLATELLPTASGELTIAFTKIKYSAIPELTLYKEDDVIVIPGFRFVENKPQFLLQYIKSSEYDKIEVGWPAEILKVFTIIDCPGITATSADITNMPRFDRIKKLFAADTCAGYFCVLEANNVPPTVAELISDLANHLDVVQQQTFERGVIDFPPRKQAVFVANKYDQMALGNIPNIVERANRAISEFVAINWASTEFYFLSSNVAFEFVSGKIYLSSDSVECQQTLQLLRDAIPCCIQKYRTQLISEIYDELREIIHGCEILRSIFRMDREDRIAKGKELLKHETLLTSLETQFQLRAQDLVNARNRAFFDFQKTEEVTQLVQKLANGLAKELATYNSRPTSEEYQIELLKAIKKYNRWIIAKHPQVNLTKLFENLSKAQLETYCETINCLNEATIAFSFLVPPSRSRIPTLFLQAAGVVATGAAGLAGIGLSNGAILLGVPIMGCAVLAATGLYTVAVRTYTHYAPGNLAADRQQWYNFFQEQSNNDIIQIISSTDQLISSKEFLHSIVPGAQRLTAAKLRNLANRRTWSPPANRFCIATEKANFWLNVFKTFDSNIPSIPENDMTPMSISLSNAGTCKVLASTLRGEIDVAVKFYTGGYISIDSWPEYAHAFQDFVLERSNYIMVQGANICKYYGAFVWRKYDPGTLAPYMGVTSVVFGIVIERGTPLTLTYLADEFTPEAKRKKFLKSIRDIARGIATMHQCGIIHRDIKPGNIIITTEGLKLIDLGVSKHLRQYTATRVGTRGWQAPEVARGLHGQRVDVYSFAMVAISLWKGTHHAVGEHFDIGDPDLSALERKLKLCLDSDVAKRPYLKEILAEIEELCSNNNII